MVEDPTLARQSAAQLEVRLSGSRTVHALLPIHFFVSRNHFWKPHSFLQLVPTVCRRWWSPFAIRHSFLMKRAKKSPLEIIESTYNPKSRALCSESYWYAVSARRIARTVFCIETVCERCVQVTLEHFLPHLTAWLVSATVTNGPHRLCPLSSGTELWPVSATVTNGPLRTKVHTGFVPCLRGHNYDKFQQRSPTAHSVQRSTQALSRVFRDIL
jgi:hypothetical protein